MLSGSADKTIKLWKAGRCENTYTGNLVQLIPLMLLTRQQCLFDAEYRNIGACLILTALQKGSPFVKIVAWVTPGVRDI